MSGTYKKTEITRQLEIVKFKPVEPVKPNGRIKFAYITLPGLYNTGLLEVWIPGA